MGLHDCKTVLHVQTPNTVLLSFGLLHSYDSPLYACRYSLVLQRYVVIPKHSNCSVKFIGLPIYLVTSYTGRQSNKYCPSISESGRSKLTLLQVI